PTIQAHAGPQGSFTEEGGSVAVSATNSNKPYENAFMVGVRGVAESAGVQGVSPAGTGVQGIVGGFGASDAEESTSIAVHGAARWGTGGLFSGMTGLRVVGLNRFSQAD